MPEPDGGDDLDDLDDDAADPDASPAPGPRTRRGRRRGVVVAGVVVAVVVAAGVVRGAAADGGDGTGQGDGPPLDGTATAEQLFPVLAEQPVNPLTSLDDPAGPTSPASTSAGAGSAGSGSPDGPLAASLGVVPGSARRLGATSSVTLWLARGSDGDVCLLAGDADSPAFGGTCATAARAAARGVQLRAGNGAAAVAVPRGFDTSELAAAGYARIAPALWVDGETAGRTAEALVDTATAATVVVPSGSHRGDDALAVFLTTDGAPYAAVLACPQDAALRVAVDGAAPHAVSCGSDASFVTFDGDGGPTRVQVTAPRGAVWAAGVVACSGSLLGPQC